MVSRWALMDLDSSVFPFTRWALASQRVEGISRFVRISARSPLTETRTESGALPFFRRYLTCQIRIEKVCFVFIRFNFLITE